MKVLVLGNLNSIWAKEFAQYVLLPSGAEIFFQNNYNNSVTYADYYSESGVTVIPAAVVSSWIMKIPKIRAVSMMKHQKKILSEFAPFDVIIIMFVTPEHLATALSLKRKDTKVYAYFCGSDIIRASTLTCLRLRNKLKKTDQVVFASNSVQDAYLQKIGDNTKNHHSIIRLGLSNFNLIDSQLSEGGKISCKSAMSIEPDKITICIGYNGNKEQNHLPVLEQLKSLPRTLLSKVVLLLPMTYGGTQEYLADIENTVHKTGVEYRLFREYMNRHQIAQLRLATDILINAQDTDGLSGSVLEAMYAGVSLLSASWLRYKEYDEWGLKYTSFSKYGEISSLLSRAIQSIHESGTKNREILKDKMSWEKCRESWDSLLVPK